MPVCDVAAMAPHAVFVDIDAEPGRSDTSTCPRSMRMGRPVTSSLSPSFDKVRPQASCGSAAARCSPAAQAMLDSPVLQATLTDMASSAQRRPAAITPRMPPSLMVLRLTPRAALAS